MGEKSNNLWINEWDPDRPQNYIDVYTDGSCEKNGDDDASAGAGIFCAHDPGISRAIRIPKSLKQTNQTGEIIAIKEAVEGTHALDGLTTLRQKWEDTGVTTARLRTRKAISTMKKVKAHVGIEGNEEADRLANEGRVKPNEDAIDMVIPGHLRLTGAKLRCMNQSMLYKAIKIQKMKRPQQQKKLNRRATSENIERAKLGAMTISGKTPTAKRIWCSLRHKDFSRQFRYFLWMTIHNGYMIGRFWDRTEEPWKGTCAFCGVEETMEHILTECRGPGMEEIWSLCEDLWRNKKTEWIRPSFNEIMSCGLTELKDSKNNISKGDSRLYRILVSESAHLIWKLRNARVIQGKGFPSTEEILNKWRYQINARLRTDCLLTNSRYGCKKVKKTIVIKTWQDVLHDRDNLAEDWTKDKGVLVMELKSYVYVYVYASMVWGRKEGEEARKEK
ncbi:ribonuclease H-like protein [Lentinula raphanica]|uniref:ribonuclease H n=1 Tax=Lentinula raphanica TaxID=153919 RepID=A0AA38UDV6_9AGAR|nr:ribonuclease H-like protein [Lentinula raphanica]